MSNNLYLVISEVITGVVWEDWFNQVGHEEKYRIAELVVARNHSQARWLAWGNDRDSFTATMKDMPRFTCRIQEKDIDRELGIVSDLPEFQNEGYWGPPDMELP